MEEGDDDPLHVESVAGLDVAEAALEGLLLVIPAGNGDREPQGVAALGTGQCFCQTWFEVRG
jgi:hypothetical protein